LGASYYGKAKSAIWHSMQGHRPATPAQRPILRVTFDYEPGWELLSLVRAFDHDAFPVFGQALKITDAYYGCFEADFEPSDQRAERLDQIASQIAEASDFDDLIAKYRILMVKLFNFPNRTSEFVVNYIDPLQVPVSRLRA
jgi:hypothetical protein